MKRFHRSLAAATVSLTALMALGGGAQASSFYIRTGQSAEGLGMQFAGGASGGIGIGSIGWNPATITMFPGRNSNWNATYIRPQAEYDLQFTNVLPTPLAGPLFGTPLGTGEIGGNGAFAPASYSAFQINDRLWLGLATGAPFGLSAKPDNYNFAGQVYGRSARIKTINVAPTVGYKVTDWLSIGAAAQFQYLKVNLKQAIAAFPNAPNLILEGDDIALGYRLGATITPWQGGSFGVGYRSAMFHEVTGDIMSAVPIPTLAGPILPGPGFLNPLEAKINLPDVLTFGFSQQLSPQWQVHLGVERENWSRFKRVPLILGRSNLPFRSLNFEYDDSLYVSGGVEYAWSPNLTLRAGVSHEWSAVSDRVRQLLIADNDRLGVSVGASYNWNERLKIDIGYAHYFIKDAPAAIVPPGAPSTPPATRISPASSTSARRSPRSTCSRSASPIAGTPRRSRYRPPRSCGSTEAQQASSNKRKGRRQRRPFPFKLRMGV